MMVHGFVHRTAGSGSGYVMPCHGTGAGAVKADLHTHTYIYMQGTYKVARSVEVGWNRMERKRKARPWGVVPREGN